jgi:hypothetical protein
MPAIPRKDFINIFVPSFNSSLRIYKFQDYERFDNYVRTR